MRGREKEGIESREGNEGKERDGKGETRHTSPSLLPATLQVLQYFLHYDSSVAWMTTNL